MPNSAKIRDDLAEVLKGVSSLKHGIPVKGWIRSIREALGMSGRQLALRIQVAGSRIPEMEKAEAHGNITLKSLRRAAEAMDCELVYAFIPKTDLESSLRIQAEKAAKQKLESIAQTMRLEEQGLNAQADVKLLTQIMEKCIQKPPRWLWDA